MRRSGNFMYSRNVLLLVQLSNQDIGNVLIPSKDEQSAITEVLLLADNELCVLHNTKSHYEIQKKGLMQKLLTGEVRVKVGG